MHEDLKILALTLYGEARGEPIESIIGVGSVIRNRTFDRSKSYEFICLEPKQFSCWNETDPNYKVLNAWRNNPDSMDMNKYLKQCIFIASGIISGDLLSNVSKANHYVETSLFLKLPDTHWAKKLAIVTVKGNHTFLLGD